LWFAAGKAENGAMRATMRIATLATVVLCVVVPGAIELAASGVLEPQKTRSSQPPESRVDINHAGLDELLKVPGMTRSWAARIVRFRPYHAKNDLLDRGVVPSEVYDRIKDYVVAHRDRQ
jgi:DNA uptake protein ComE-like DNA-binding protein